MKCWRVDSRFTRRFNAEILAYALGRRGLDLTMSRYLRLGAANRVLDDRVATAFTNNHTTKPAQVFEKRATFHRRSAMRAPILSWIVSTNTAFLSRARGLGRGRVSPCSSL